MTKKSAPWLPADYKIEEAGAIQAVATGTASEAQQQRAIRFIVEVLCGNYDLSFRPDDEGGERATAFAEGRRFVGLQIVKLSKLNLQLLRDRNGRRTSSRSKE